MSSPLSEEERNLVHSKLKDKFDEAELKEFQDVEIKAMSIFFSKNPNVEMEHRIPDTNYAFYRLSKTKLQEAIDFIEKNKGAGPGMP